MIYRLQNMDLIDERVKDGVGERLEIERFNIRKIGEWLGEIYKLIDRKIEI